MRILFCMGVREWPLASYGANESLCVLSSRLFLPPSPPSGIRLRHIFQGPRGPRVLQIVLRTPLTFSSRFHRPHPH